MPGDFSAWESAVSSRAAVLSAAAAVSRDRFSKRTCFSQHTGADAFPKSFLRHHVNGPTEKLLEIHEESAEVEETAPFLPFDVFVAEWPAIPGCVSQGKTEPEALANIEDAIRHAWSADVREVGLAGRPPRQPHHLVKSGHIASLSVPDDTEVARGTLRSLLRRSGVSLEEFVKAWG